MRFTFEQGVDYYVGFDRPFIASSDAIRAAATNLGFTVVQLGPCENVQLPFTPPTPCDTNWDYLAFVRRDGETESFDLPGRIKWVLDTSQPGPAKPLPTAPTGPAPGSKFWVTATLAAVTAGGILAAVVIAGRRRA